MSEFMHTCIYGLSKLSKIISTILAGRTTKSKTVHVIKKKLATFSSYYEANVIYQNYWVFGLCPLSGIL
jgi:hypothetical protein